MVRKWIIHIYSSLVNSVHVAEKIRTEHLPVLKITMGRGEAKNKRKANKEAEGGEKKVVNVDGNVNPPSKNRHANFLCELSPYNLAQLRDAESKHYARISGVEVEVFRVVRPGVLAADLLSTAVDVACVI